MQIRLDTLLTFDNETTQEEIQNAMIEIVNAMWDNAVDVDIIHQDEV